MKTPVAAGIVSAVTILAVVLPVGLLTDSNDPPPFDMNAFIEGELNGAFEPDADRIGVVALVPAEAELNFDRELGPQELVEFEGYTYVPPETVASLAGTFAEANDTELLNGDWVAFGLIPQFADSPTDDWVATLESFPGVIVRQVEFALDPYLVPEGWSVVADLPFGIVGGAIVTTVDSQVIILQPESSHVVASDGTWEIAAAAPISIDEFCCGGAHALPADDPLVFGTEGSHETWIFEPATGIWAQADARPSSVYVLGSSVIDRELFVVDAAARTGVATSSVAALNLDTGKWRELEPVPAPISVGGVTTDGVRLIVAGTQQDENNNVKGERSPLVFALTPGQGWEALPNIPIDGQASTVVWTPQGDLLAWNYDLESARLSTIEEGWTRLEPVSMNEGNCYPRSVAASFGVVGFCFGIAWFDGSTWQLIPDPPPKSHLVVTADGLLGIHPLGRDESQLIRFDLGDTES